MTPFKSSWDADKAKLRKAAGKPEDVLNPFELVSDHDTGDQSADNSKGATEDLNVDGEALVDGLDAGVSADEGVADGVDADGTEDGVDDEADEADDALAHDEAKEAEGLQNPKEMAEQVQNPKGQNQIKAEAHVLLAEQSVALEEVATNLSALSNPSKS